MNAYKWNRHQSPPADFSVAMCGCCLRSPPTAAREDAELVAPLCSICVENVHKGRDEKNPTDPERWFERAWYNICVLCITAWGGFCVNVIPRSERRANRRFMCV